MEQGVPGVAQSAQQAEDAMTEAQWINTIAEKQSSSDAKFQSILAALH